MSASRVDFLVLNKKLEKYCKLLEDNFGLSLNCSMNERRKLGFYVYIIENLCDESDINKIAECIIDNNFNRLIFSQAVDDVGVDAV